MCSVGGQVTWPGWGQEQVLHNLPGLRDGDFGDPKRAIKRSLSGGSHSPSAWEKSGLNRALRRNMGLFPGGWGGVGHH